MAGFVLRMEDEAMAQMRSDDSDIQVSGWS